MRVSLSFNRSAIGILMTLLTIMFGVITGLCVRSVGDAVPLITVLMYRFVCSIPLLLLLALAVRGRQFLHVNARRTLMVRIAFGCAAMTLWFTSLRLLPLGQATALFQSSVIFVTIFSPLMLGERIGIYRWSAVVTGMIGIVLLTNPFDGGFSFNVVFGIGGAMAGAALSILLRRLGKADNPFSLALWYNGTGGILLTMLALTVGVPMVVPDQTVMATLVLLGVVASGLQLCITTAYKFSEAVVVASLRYMQIPLAALVAYLALGETVTLSEVVGGVVVIGSCLFIVWREMKQARTATSASAPADPVS